MKLTHKQVKQYITASMSGAVIAVAASLILSKIALLIVVAVIGVIMFKYSDRVITYICNAVNNDDAIDVE